MTDAPPIAGEGRLQDSAINDAVLDVLLLRLRHAVHGEDELIQAAYPDAAGRLEKALDDAQHEPAIASLERVFGLDPFARDVLMLAFAFDVESRFAEVVTPLTVGVAMATLPGARWDAFDASAPLTSFRLLQCSGDGPLGEQRVALAPSVRAFLLGAGEPPSDGGFWLAEDLDAGLLPNDGLRVALAAADDTAPATVLVLHGSSRGHRHDLARAAAAVLDVHLSCVAAVALPPPGRDLDLLLRGVDRDARLSATGILVELDGPAEPIDTARIEAVVRGLQVPVIVSADHAVAMASDRPVVWFEVTGTPPSRRYAAWRDGIAALVPDGALDRPEVDASLQALAGRFDVDESQIARWCRTAGLLAPIPRRVDEALSDVGDVARRRTRRDLDGLAQRLPAAALPRLVLPESQLEELDAFVRTVEQRYQVSEVWEMSPGDTRGASALFGGQPGTGKTLAARVLGARLGLDVYRVDLARTVSKYIGETERNLDRLLTAAEAGGALLLFDEGDALFGRRGEVKDSQDRFANMQVSFLLQRIESSAAPVVVTTNLRDAIDPAFTRRFRVIVDFPFPDQAARRQLWEEALPPAAPTESLDLDALASFAVTGAAIRDIALRAAYAAAAERASITMDRLRAAARSELRKAGRDLVGSFAEPDR